MARFTRSADGELRVSVQVVHRLTRGEFINVLAYWAEVYHEYGNYPPVMGMERQQEKVREMLEEDGESVHLRGVDDERAVEWATQIFDETWRT